LVKLRLAYEVLARPLYVNDCSWGISLVQSELEEQEKSNRKKIKIFGRNYRNSIEQKLGKKNN